MAGRYVDILRLLFDNESDDDGEEEEDSEVEEEDEAEDDESEEEEDEEDNEAKEDVYLGRDKITKWSKKPTVKRRTPSKDITSRLPGFQGPARTVATPLEAFMLYFDNDILDILVDCTNKYIQTYASKKFANSWSCKEVNRVEMKALLGLLIMSGLLRCNHLNIEELFSSDCCGVEIFRLTMSYQRFLFLLRCLRFDDCTTRAERRKQDRLAPIRHLFEKIVQKFSQFYTPGEHLTIDEQLVGFHGKCQFREYIKSKPRKYGMKIFALVDSHIYYTLNMEIYAGKQPAGPYQVNNSGQSVVKRLIAVPSVSGTNRNITTDNGFTSIPLALSLLRDHRLTLVGTMRKNKKEIPHAFQANKTRPVKQSLFGFCGPMTMVSYVPKRSKSVLLLSTMHSRGIIDPSGDKHLPEIIGFYNSTKGGVDVVDQMCASYNVARKSRRWPLVVFYHLINVSAINACLVYNKNHNWSGTRRHFLKTLAKELVRTHHLQRMVSPHIPRATKKRLHEVTGTPEYNPPTPKKRGSVGHCATCRKSSRNTCPECFRYMCSAHEVKTRKCEQCANGQETDDDV